MSNNYFQCTPTNSLKATKEESDELRALLEEAGEDVFHGCTIEYDENSKYFYLYFEEGEPSELPTPFLKTLGKLIRKNRMRYLEFGYAVYCDKMEPGEFNGGSFRITSGGKFWYPTITWEKKKTNRG